MSSRSRFLMVVAFPALLVGCTGFGQPVGPDGQPLLSPEEQRLQDVEDKLALLTRRMDATEQAGTDQELIRLLDEMRGLRGDLEKVRYDLDRAQKNQTQLYQDLDRRLTAQGTAGLAPATGAALGASPGTLTAVTPQPRPAVASPEEEGAYLATFDLLKNGRYDDAIRGFRAMLEKWPDGRYADNAWYWMGEAQYVKRDYPSALQSFQSLIQRFPDSPKMADGLLKSGLCQVELKRTSEARSAFERVVSQYPNSNAASLARQNLQQLGG